MVLLVWASGLSKRRFRRSQLSFNAVRSPLTDLHEFEAGVCTARQQSLQSASFDTNVMESRHQFKFVEKVTRSQQRLTES